MAKPEYIDREAFLDYMKGTNRYFSVKFDIENFPAADVAPVVHCRHCRSYNKPQLGWCSVHLDREGPDDFCGYGKRNEVT